jgi:hypothetical protein
MNPFPVSIRQKDPFLIPLLQILWSLLRYLHVPATCRTAR